MSKVTSKRFLRYKKGYKSKLIKDIFRQIQQGESFTLMGMPGIGKTEIYQSFDANFEFWQELFPKKKIDFLFISLDLTKLLDISPLGFYKLLLNRLYKTITSNIKEKTVLDQSKEILNESKDKQDLFTIFSSVEELIKLITQVLGYKLCILIDDFATVADFNKQFFNSLKAIRNINKWKVTLAFSSNRDLLTTLNLKILDELYDIFLNKKFWLKPISEKEAFLGMEEWEKERGIKLPKQVKKKFFKISGGHPGYMRALSRVYFDQDEKLSIFDEKNIEKLADSDPVRARSEKLWTRLLDEYKEFLTKFINNPDVNTNHKSKYLENTGVIQIRKNQRKLFSPLLEYFIKSHLRFKPKKDISIKESLHIEPKTKTIYVDGKPLAKEPTNSEYKILQLLYKNKGNIVSREELSETLWGTNAVEKYSDWAIDRTVSRIRKKIGDSASNPRFIQTIKGRGLRLLA